MSLTSDDEDFDMCRISQDDTRFSPCLKSPYCPRVGTCGHSFADKNLKDWFQVRKKGEDHKNKTTLPCPYGCSETIKRGTRQEIKAFRPHKLVPNRSLCQAVQVIHHRQEGSKDTPASMKVAATFDQCPKCEKKFSTETKASKGKQKKRQHPQTPMVGLCGHTICLGCLESINKSKSKLGKTVSCPTCKQGKAFCCDQLVENIDFGRALRHWKTMMQPAHSNPAADARKPAAKTKSARKKPATIKKAAPKKVSVKKAATNKKSELAASKRNRQSTGKRRRSTATSVAQANAEASTASQSSRPNKRARRK